MVVKLDCDILKIYLIYILEMDKQVFRLRIFWTNKLLFNEYLNFKNNLKIIHFEFYLNSLTHTHVQTTPPPHHTYTPPYTTQLAHTQTTSS